MLNRNYNKSGSYFCFLIAPFLTFVYSIFHLRKKESLYIVGAFFILYMYSIEYNLKDSYDLDGWNHATYYEKSTISDFVYNIKTAFLIEHVPQGNWYLDSYINIVGIIAKLFGGSYHLFFALVALFYSTFFVKSLKIILRECKFDDKLVAATMIFWLFMSFHIFSLTGVRFPSAAWFSIWCTLKLYIDKDKKYLAILFLSTQIHFTFWFYCIIVLIGYFCGKYEKVWIVLALISSFFMIIPESTVENVFQQLPSIFSERALSYGADRSNDVAEAISQSNFRKYLNPVGSFIQVAILVMLICNKHKIKKNGYYNVFLLLLVVTTFTNFFSFMPDMGRFRTLCNPLKVICLSMIPLTGPMKVCIYLIPLTLILSVVDLVTLSLSILPANFLYSNVFFIMFN